MTRKQKIIIFIDWFLPGTKSGGPVRSYANLIEHFKDEFDFFVITRDTDYCDKTPYTTIQKNAWNIYNKNTQIYYVSKDNLNIKSIKEVIQSKNYDIALINGVYSWWFSIIPLLILKRSPIRKIVSARGMLSSQAFSVKRRKKKIFLCMAKMVGLYKEVFFHATNEVEANCIQSEIGKNTIVKVAPNLPRVGEKLKLKQRNKKEGVLNLVSIARISKEKGTLKALEGILACANSDYEKILFHLYGTLNDLEYWNKCKNVIKLLPDNVEVNYRGSIESDKVPCVLENYDFLFLPSEGENFGHAILESLSVGTPVIISDNTPWRNLAEKKAGWDVSLSDPKLLKKTLDLALEMKQKEYCEWSGKAYAFAKEFCNNKDLIEKNRALFNKNI